MRIFVPPRSPGEHRVPLTPEITARLVETGHEVVVAVGAGSDAGFTDDAYREAGAEVVDDASGWDADLIVSISRPEHEVSTAVLGLLKPFDDPEGIEHLAADGAALFAFEAVPRTTRAQVVDALSSQATAAGYQAVIEAAAASDRFFPMLTTAAGTIRPAKIVVLGAGVAGLQAIATARRLGAMVAAFDVRAAAAEQVESLGATFITVDVEAQDASKSGGYAQEVGQDTQALIIAGLAPHVASADAVITAAAIPGREAPLLIDSESIAAMRPGAVIVDLAASTGGNTQATEPGTVTVSDGVTVIGTLNLEAKVAGDASRMYARNVHAFVELLAGENGSFDPDWEDEIVRESCVAREGRLVHPRLTQETP